MQRVIISGAIAALAYRAAAGVVARGDSDISFVDQSWDDVCEGSVWPIKWSKGNGNNLSLKVKGGDSWEDTICESEAAPGSEDWTVEVPKCDAEYTLEIQQDDCEVLISPKFTVACAGEDGEWEDEDEPEDGNGPKPSKVIVVYYEEDCSCTKTKETSAPTHSSPVWYDDDLKCSVTIDPASPTHVWEDAPADPKTWSDASVDPAHTWGDGPAPADPKTWGDASVDPAAKTTAAGGTWADAADPAAKTPAASGTWGDAAAPVAATPAAGGQNVANYTGAASKLTGSIGALAAIFLAALAL